MKHVRDDIVVLVDSLREHAGNPAWEGVAWAKADDAAQPVTQDLADKAHRQVTRFNGTLPKRYKAYTFDALRVHGGNTQAVEAAKALTSDSNLFIHGSAGNGKTHLAVAAGFRLAEEGYSVEFYSVVELFNRIRASFSTADPVANRPDLTRPDVLILDDLGKVKPTEFVFQEFYAAVENRWANERSTIFTANHRASEAAAHLSPDAEGAAAVLSRMASGGVVGVAGVDERLGARR